MAGGAGAQDAPGVFGDHEGGPSDACLAGSTVGQAASLRVRAASRPPVCSWGARTTPSWEHGARMPRAPSGWKPDPHRRGGRGRVWMPPPKVKNRRTPVPSSASNRFTSPPGRTRRICPGAVGSGGPRGARTACPRGAGPDAEPRGRAVRAAGPPFRSPPRAGAKTKSPAACAAGLREMVPTN